MLFFFFQAEDGIRDAQESRGLGDVYKRQVTPTLDVEELDKRITDMKAVEGWLKMNLNMLQMLSLIHI